MKIVILDADTISPGVLKYDEFEKYGEVIAYKSTPKELVAERIGDAKYVCTDGSFIGKEVMDQCTRLKWIGVMATGYDRVDVDYAKQKGIVVCNAPAYASQVVSQHAFSLLFFLCNHLKEYSEAVYEGNWITSPNFAYWKYPIMELYGKTIGIFGFGGIAKHSAKIAEAFGLNVLMNANHTDKSYETSKIQFAERDTLFKKADIVFLHCPLNESNRNLINKESIALMKDGVIIINTARGALINENDLANALITGKVAGVGLDVLAEESPVIHNQLIGMKNCIITPHIAWNSQEARERLVEITINNLSAFLRGDLLNCVN